MSCKKSILFIVGIAAALASGAAAANDIAASGVFNDVVSKFASQAGNWRAAMESAATWLFWTLATISMVITFGFMALRRADLGEFFAEFVRTTLFFGFFFWLLKSGPSFGSDIINSTKELAGLAQGAGVDVSPSGVVDQGFAMLDQAITHTKDADIADRLVSLLLGFASLIVLSLIAINMVILEISAWVMLFAGIFFLGFGGSRWTSDMAINYYKTTLGIGIQLMAMLLVTGVGLDVLKSYFAASNSGVTSWQDTIAVLVASLVIYLLSSKIPPLLAGMVTSGAGGSSVIGSASLAGAIAAGTATASGMLSAAKGASGISSAASIAARGTKELTTAAAAAARTSAAMGSGLYASGGVLGGLEEASRAMGLGSLGATVNEKATFIAEAASQAAGSALETYKENRAENKQAKQDQREARYRDSFIGQTADNLKEKVGSSGDDTSNPARESSSFSSGNGISGSETSQDKQDRERS